MFLKILHLHYTLLKFIFISGNKKYGGKVHTEITFSPILCEKYDQLSIVPIGIASDFNQSDSSDRN